MSNFQTIFVAIFLAFFVFAVLIFSGIIKIGGLNGGDGKPAGKVVIWGVFPSSFLSDAISKMKADNRDLNISYVKKEVSTYQQDLIEAFANGAGPDLFIVTPDMLKKNINFIYKIPYASYPEKTFRDAFVDGADIYLEADGFLGFPVLVDPMVLYYNKDILANEGMVSPPSSWDELLTLNSSLTKRDNIGTISQSMIALGQYGNVNNSKDILATLLLQNGNNIVERGADSKYVARLNSNPSNLSISPLVAVLQFFIEFSNPTKTAYSWNRSLPDSRDMFTGGKLAFYLGKASELFTIESINPNLSFDVTAIPQIKNTQTKRTGGDIYAIAINKRSTNTTSAFAVAGLLSQGEVANVLSMGASLPPASRALLSTRPTNPYLYTFFNGAVVARSWLDPDRVKTDAVFRDLVENILSNNLSVYEAINKAEGQLELLVK
ncbi:MAG: extracellular solute-binding protein [Candidatus Paceibacterota bacterium]|jgi:ABC-type glycerol-3-phosphate transport system substrate-binding protein